MLVERGAPADLLARAEAVTAEEALKATTALGPYRARLEGRRVLLYTGGVKSWAMIGALQELGMTVVSTSVRKSTDEDKDRIRQIMGDDAPMVDESRRRSCGACWRAARPTF